MYINAYIILLIEGDLGGNQKMSHNHISIHEVRDIVVEKNLFEDDDSPYVTIKVIVADGTRTFLTLYGDTNKKLNLDVK